ncbi:MAG: hypothetical protein ACYDA0_07750 [Candidatus Dormibacteraceae bacterium]
MKLLPRILADEDELDQQAPVTSELATTEKLTSESSPRLALWATLIAVGALVPRLAYLFIVSDPENAGQGFTDAYHHWQIAYLTKEIGLTHGPRLWDLRGVEYFWGLMHPFLMDLLFFATGSVDIVLARLLSLAFGTLAVVLIFLLCHRYWGLQVAVAASAFAALSPASVFNDDAGMVEPIAISLLLLGIWLTPKRGFWAGVAWGCAALARVEAWLFAAGLVVAWVIGRRSAAQRFPLVAGWALVMGFYLKFLFDHTGNPIYPLYWNFQVVALGATETNTALTPEQQLLRVPLGAIVLVSAAGLAWALWKRPPAFLLLTYGFGYWVFQAGTLGFTHYLIHTTEWMERRFEFPLDFAAILVAALLFKLVPRFRERLRPAAWAAAAAALVGVQLFWIPIQQAYAATEPGYQDQVRLGRAIGQVFSRAEYRGGAIAVPGDEPTLIYTMVRDGGVPGAQITSEFYDPFYYLPRGYRYTSHKDVAGPLLQCWLSSTHTRLLLIPPASTFSASVRDYHAFITDNPQWFGDTGVQLGEGFALVAVQVPAPSPSVCSDAAKAAPH